jgi:hypothetical protein
MMISIIFLINLGSPFAETAPLLNDSPETIILKRRLGEIVLEKRALEQEQKAWVHTAIQPYREYLLLQRSIDFAELSARLEQLEREGEIIARRLAQNESVPEEAIKAMVGPPPELFPTFSGAPPLSFNEVSRIDETLSYRPGWTPFSRLIISGMLLLIVIFPLAALIKIIHLRRQKRAFVTQLSFRKREGPDHEIPKKKAA